MWFLQVQEGGGGGGGGGGRLTTPSSRHVEKILRWNKKYVKIIEEKKLKKKLE